MNSFHTEKNLSYCLGRCASLTKDLAQALEELDHYKKTKPRMSVKHIKDDEDKVH